MQLILSADGELLPAFPILRDSSSLAYLEARVLLLRLGETVSFLNKAEPPQGVDTSAFWAEFEVCEAPQCRRSCAARSAGNALTS